VLEADTIRQAERAKDEMEILGLVVGTNLRLAFLGLMPQIIDLTRWFGEVTQAGAILIERVFKPLSERSLAAVEDQAGRVVLRIRELNAQIRALEAGADLGRSPGGRVKLEGLTTERAKLQAEFDELKARADALRGSFERTGEAGAAAFQMTKTEVTALDAALKSSLASLDRQARSIEQLFDATRTPAEKLSAEIERLNGLLQSGAIDWDLYARGIGKAQDEFSKLADISAEVAVKTTETDNLARDLGLTFTSAFEDAVIAGNSFRDVLRGIAQDLLRLALRQTVTKPLLGALDRLFNPSTLGLGSLASGAPGLEEAGLLFGGGPRQHGGPVWPGAAFTVGEAGPELFVPDVGGTVIPNSGFSTGGTYYIDARGADRAGMARLEAMIAALNGSIEPRSVAAVVGARNRNPGLLR
jgi:hypothetical protein